MDRSFENQKNHETVTEASGLKKELQSDQLVHTCNSIIQNLVEKAESELIGRN